MEISICADFVQHRRVACIIPRWKLKSRDDDQFHVWDKSLEYW